MGFVVMPARLVDAVCHIAVGDGPQGTAVSEEEELYEVYGLPVTEVPTHRPRIRIDHPPIVFFR